MSDVAALLKICQQQQDQISQLLATKTPAPSSSQVTVPPLPDIVLFEPSDDKSRIDEWLQRFCFAIDCSSPNLAADLKVKALMNKLSENAFSDYTKSCLPKEVTDFNFDQTVENLKQVFSRHRSIFLDRFELLKSVKGDNEDLRTFVMRHKRLIKDFKFTDMTENQFQVLMLLLALKAPRDATLRQRILSKLTQEAATVTYDKVIEDCLSFMTTLAEAKLVESSSNKQVNVFNKNGGKSKGGKWNNPKYQAPKNNANNPSRSCWRCGKGHLPNDCQFRNSTCRKCNRQGHIEARCDAVQEWKKAHPFKGAKAKSDDKHAGLVYVRTALKTINSSSLLRTKILMNNKPVNFALDTGAEINVIDEDSYAQIGRPAIKKCSEKAKLYDGSTRSFIGKGTTSFQFDGICIEQDFYLAKKGALNLLSIQAMDEFGLLDEIKSRIERTQINLASKTKASTPKESEQKQIENFVGSLNKTFPNVFKDGLGLCTKMKAHLALKPDATPIFRRARPVPYNVKGIVEDELDRLESLGVIKQVEHSEWSAPVLVVKKANGATRLCCDYSTGLNEALLPNKHPLPIPEDIFSTLNGGKYFSQLDLRDAYFQIELDNESRKLCCINTHRGLYELVRLPFGVKTAPSIFQNVMDAMLSGLPFAFAYLDDIIVVGKTVEEHKQNVVEVLKRLESYGFRLKSEKCSFFQKQIKYLGVFIDEHGRKPDPEKIKAITNMPAPHDISSLRSFLGMVNHYQQFLKNLRFTRKPLDDLLKKEKEWSWDEKCKEAFRKIKELLTSDLLLTHYDPKQEIIVAADASEKGIGAVISHRFKDGSIKAVAHASSTLNPAQQNYSQIEKEALALIFAIQKFHKMIYGRHFTLLTDHKPLLAIFGSKKGIRQCSANRLLRWSLMLLAYDFTIEYVNTLDFGQADALSRLIARKDDDEDERVIANIDAETDLGPALDEVTKFLPITFKHLVSEMDKDEILKKVISFIRKGWPDVKQMKNESEEIQLFSRRKDSLTIQNGCLMYTERVVIPSVFQQKVLQLLHKGHPGMKRMKQLARKYAYWPNIDTQIESFVRNCEPCQSAARAPVKTELRSWPKASGPWTRVHIDYAGPYYGKQFAVIVDAYSKYPEVFEMRTISSASTIEKLRYLFSRHGLPEVLVSDNGTQFTSNEFARFTNANGIKHLFSAPYNPMSNGQAERFVDTFKRAFSKLKGEGVADPRILETFLVTYRTTPNDSLPGCKTPAELFLGRKPRTTLDLLMPPPPIPTERNEEMEKRFNRRFGTKVRTFGIGDKVFARHRTSQSWRAGIISKGTGVIYDVEFLDGSSNRFHANQLRERHTANQDNEHLAVIHETFGLPLIENQEVPPVVQDVPRVEQVPLAEPEQAEPVVIPQPNEPVEPQAPQNSPVRRSERNRRPRTRYSPT